MSSSILSLKTLISYSSLKCAPRRRRFCHASTASPPEQLHLHLQKLGQSLVPSVVVLESHFSPPGNNWDIHNCPRLATGFFLHPTLIATSALAVGHVTPSREDAIQHQAHIARTIAFTPHGVVLTTRPLAVNFSRGVAVLEVVHHSAAAPLPRGCALAESPPGKDSILLAVAAHQSTGFGMVIGNVRGGAAAERSIRAEAPWPLNDESGWIEHGWFGVGIGDPAPGSSSAAALSDVSVARILGSPWFNLVGEVVGVASWEVKDAAAQFSVGFAAPAASIRAVADYVKTKEGDDPVVMDSWIDAHHLNKCHSGSTSGQNQVQKKKEKELINKTSSSFDLSTDLCLRRSTTRCRRWFSSIFSFPRFFREYELEFVDQIKRRFEDFNCDSDKKLTLQAQVCQCPVVIFNPSEHWFDVYRF